MIFFFSESFVLFGSVLALRHLIDITEEDESIADARRASRIARYERRIVSYGPAMRGIIQSELPRPTPRGPASSLSGLALTSTPLPPALVGRP